MGVVVGVGVGKILVSQFAVAVLGLFMRIAFDIDREPVASPLHPVKMCWILLPSSTVVWLTTAYAELPSLYHPSPDEEPYSEDTVSQ